MRKFKHEWLGVSPDNIVNNIEKYEVDGWKFHTLFPTKDGFMCGLFVQEDNGPPDRIDADDNMFGEQDPLQMSPIEKAN